MVTLGTGTDAKIEVKLKDGTRLKGYISEANNDQFVVTDPTTGTKTTVPYPQVQTAKRKNNKWVVLALAAGIAVAVIVTVKSLD